MVTLCTVWNFICLALISIGTVLLVASVPVDGDMNVSKSKGVRSLNRTMGLRYVSNKFTIRLDFL